MEKSTTYNNSAGFRCLQNIKRQTNDLYLVHCGQQQCPPGYTYAHKRRNEFHLHFVLKGKGVLNINSTTYHLERGHIFVLPPDISSDYYADHDTPWEYVWVTFNGLNAKNYLEYAGITDATPVITSTIAPEIYLELIKKLLDANSLTYANELKRVGILFEILSSLIEAQCSIVSSRIKHYDYSSETYIEHALQYIAYNYHHIKVNDIAKNVGINRSYLAYIFKKKLQISPMEYLIKYRLNKAAELIKTTCQPIQEIAATVGYEDPLTFSKMFKRKYGLSPKNYRSQQSDVSILE